MNTIPEHDVFLRLTVRHHVRGQVTPNKKHKIISVVRKLIRMAGGGHYTVECAEVAAVTKTR